VGRDDKTAGTALHIWIETRWVHRYLLVSHRKLDFSNRIALKRQWPSPDVSYDAIFALSSVIIDPIADKIRDSQFLS
jgi:hypothetical protein